MLELCEKLSESALRTIQFFESQLKGDGSYGKEADDLSCYYKSPMMFILANRYHLAAKVLGYIHTKYMSKNGDFKTKPSLKSIKPEYSEYWSYINGWIVRAAQKLDLNEISNPAYQYLLSFNTGNNKGFLTTLSSNKNITDVLTTAHHGLINLERGQLATAISAANYLCDAIKNQPAKGIFYLRFDSSGNAVVDFPKGQASFYSIDSNNSDQLYFMIGYPCAFLALMYKETKEKKYLNNAIAYFEFSATCHGVFESNFSHKIAWAASILYQLTGKEQYLYSTEKICNYFLNIQGEDGLWYSNSDIYTAYDQSTEIACWFLDISNTLRPKKAFEEKEKEKEKNISKGGFLSWKKMEREIPHYARNDSIRKIYLTKY
ncbi:hypothetical protein [Coxiella burnetii]|uniref:hypothetical protein n=1 Tax=Coxiella burnetii TaxID=777 RepID=UPI00051F174F|nr:hypothetical protein [Coxiella burnetii]AIT63682.1 hypothetical protein CBNA_1439 [Coxiella burnetii str. Namibia]